MNGFTGKGFCGSRDTGLLKTVAFVSMTLDHVGVVFFPEVAGFRILGRIAFPLFAYCLVIGYSLTGNVKKYLRRLFLFAILSQPFYLPLFYLEALPALFDDASYRTLGSAFQTLWENVYLNVGFELFLGLLALDGLHRKRWGIFAAAVLLSCLPAVEYGLYGMMLILLIDGAQKLPEEKFAFTVGGYLLLGFFLSGFSAVDRQGFAILALPLMLIQTDSGIRLPRWLNYGFYPMHLALLYALTILFS